MTGNTNSSGGFRSRGQWSRPGFSLAELMIAIGILGIGMLMVAATFPVGIEQTRRATEDTMVAIVADEAWSMLDLLLNDRMPRVIVGNRQHRLADLLAKMPATGRQPWDVPVDPGNPVQGGAFNLNRWLLNEPCDYGRNAVSRIQWMPAVSLYPSDPYRYYAKTDLQLNACDPRVTLARRADPRYVWSFVFRPKSGGSGLAYFTLVITRGRPPEFSVIKVNADPWDQTKLQVPDEGGVSGEQIAGELQPGALLVTAIDADAYWVVRNDPERKAVWVNRPFMQDVPNPLQKLGVPVYRVLNDPTTGGLPIVGTPETRPIRLPTSS